MAGAVTALQMFLGVERMAVLLLKTVVKCWDGEKTKPFMVRLEGSGRPS